MQSKLELWLWSTNWTAKYIWTLLGDDNFLHLLSICGRKTNVLWRLVHFEKFASFPWIRAESLKFCYFIKPLEELWSHSFFFPILWRMLAGITTNQNNRNLSIQFHDYHLSWETPMLLPNTWLRYVFFCSFVFHTFMDINCRMMLTQHFGTWKQFYLVLNAKPHSRLFKENNT